MLVVKSMEVEEVQGDITTLISHLNESLYNPIVLNTDKGAALKTVEAVQEIIRGRRFQTPKGKVVIGLSEAVADILDINYRAWASNVKLCEEQARIIGRQERLIALQGEDVKDLRSQNQGYRIQIATAKTAPWYTRLKWLFIGVEV